MADVSYSDPRLAAVYDALNPAGEDTAFYLEMAGRMPRTILDMGCGTGQVAVELARLGHRVTAADPAGAMLAIARARPGGGAVDWIESDAAGLALEACFDLIFMTGHVFQVFLTDKDIGAALRNLRRHLAPEGRLVFETRNPALRPWQGWTRRQTRRQMNIPGVGPVEVHYDVTFADGQIVQIRDAFPLRRGRCGRRARRAQVHRAGPDRRGPGAGRLPRREMVWQLGSLAFLAHQPRDHRRRRLVRPRRLARATTCDIDISPRARHLKRGYLELEGRS